MSDSSNSQETISSGSSETTTMTTIEAKKMLEQAAIKYSDDGLVPVVTQDGSSREVLMLAYANQDAILKTLETGQAHYYSRSRQELWHKGATSGHFQVIQDIRFDCDADTLLYIVHQTGAACHTGEYSCFYRSLDTSEIAKSEMAKVDTNIGEMMMVLEQTINSRYATMPEGSYVAKLHERGQGYIAQKVVEEAGETIVAALLDNPEEMAEEGADLLFHLGVLLKEKGVGWQAVADVLAERHAKS